MSFKSNRYKDREKYRNINREIKRRYRERTGAGKYPYQHWTIEEDKLVMERIMTDRELSDLIHRSVGSIQKRRWRLKNER